MKAAAGGRPALPRAARVLFWLGFAGVAFVTLSPITLRPVTRFGPDKERFAAFALAGALFALGYPRHRLAGFALLAAAVVGLEAAQELVPGRHGRVHDAAVKVAGAAAGTVAAWIIGLVAPRRR